MRRTSWMSHARAGPPQSVVTTFTRTNTFPCRIAPHSHPRPVFHASHPRRIRLSPPQQQFAALRVPHAMRGVVRQANAPTPPSLILPHQLNPLPPLPCPSVAVAWHSSGTPACTSHTSALQPPKAAPITPVWPAAACCLTYSRASWGGGLRIPTMAGAQGAFACGAKPYFSNNVCAGTPSPTPKPRVSIREPTGHSASLLPMCSVLSLHVHAAAGARHPHACAATCCLLLQLQRQGHEERLAQAGGAAVRHEGQGVGRDHRRNGHVLLPLRIVRDTASSGANASLCLLNTSARDTVAQAPSSAGDGDVLVDASHMLFRSTPLPLSPVCSSYAGNQLARSTSLWLSRTSHTHPRRPQSLPQLQRQPLLQIRPW